MISRILWIYRSDIFICFDGVSAVSAILRPIKVVCSLLSSVRNAADHFSEFEKKLRISLSKMILCASNYFRQYVLNVKFVLSWTLGRKLALIGMFIC